jgi:undecaprenyl-diphosphatase
MSPRLVVAALAILFAALTWQVRSGGVLVIWDGRINAALTRLRRRLVLAGFAWLTQMGTGAAGSMLCLVASGLFWSDRRVELILPLWLTYAGAQATTWPLKFVTARVRPPFLEGVTAGSPSFPSAHATVSVAVYGFLALAVAEGVPQARGAVLAAAAALILLICFSRLVLSLHYLTDVLAGAVIGLAWVVIGWATVMHL